MIARTLTGTPLGRTGLRRRSGLVSVAMIAILFLLVLIGGGLVRLTWLRMTEARSAERHLQAEWLAESGIERAAARLLAKRDYPGETWSVSGADLNGLDPGVVLITIKTPPETPDRRVIHARADFPSGRTLAARSSRELTIDLKPDRKGAPSP